MNNNNDDDKVDVEKEIYDYIVAKETAGALLLKGKWGSGKTYLINSIIEKEKKNYKFIKISLFGLDSINDIEKNIIINYYLGNGTLSKNAKKISKLSNILINILPEKIAKLTFSINLLDFLEIEKNKHNKSIIIVLDDFERSRVQIDNLLGLINNYCENKKIKAIIIANEDEIKCNNDYKRFKEKVIFRTVELNNKYDSIIKKIVETYEETAYGYRDFLIKNIELLCLAFNDSGTCNLRTLKSCVIDFERVYALWKNVGLTVNENLSELLYSYSAYKYENSLGTVEIDKDLKLPVIKNKNKYTKLDSIHTINNLSKWIESGEWNETKIINEIKDSFIDKNISDDQKLLKEYFWSLDTKTINRGFPILVDNSYNGNLNQNELIMLISLMKQFHILKMKMPYEVNYDKMLKGWENRVKKIIKGEIEEPSRNRFIDDYSYLRKIDNKLYDLYSRLEKFDDINDMYKNRLDILETIDKIDAKTINDIRRKPILCIDKEMANRFISKYKSSSNKAKIDLTRLLNDIDLNNYEVPNEQDLKESIINLKFICKEMRKYSNDLDGEFEKCIVEKSANCINDKIKKINDSFGNH